jgi:hypothetical protein
VQINTVFHTTNGHEVWQMRTTASIRFTRANSIRILAAAWLIATLSVVTPSIASPSVAEASTATARTVTDCVSWQIFYGGQPEWTVCLTANDWYNGGQVATNWESPTCSVLWIVRFAWTCSSYNHGHYWNRAIGANTDWLHERINLTGAIGYAWCANVNINTKSNGYTWYDNHIYTVLLWQSC